MPSYCARKTMSVVACHKYADIWHFGSKSKTIKAFAFLEVWPIKSIYCFQGTLSVESPRSESLGNSVSPEIAMHIQGNHVEILHMWDMSTTRNRWCMRCGFGNFDFKPEKFTLKIHCFGWCMMHVPMPSHISCQKTCFFKNMSSFLLGWILPAASWCHDWMFFLVGFPKNSLKEMTKLNKFWMSRLKWWKMQFQRWEYHSNPRLGKILFLNMF